MRVLHLMVYDGPGGYCRVIYDLCRHAHASRPRVAVFNQGPWTRRMREAGIRVDVIHEIMALGDADERVRRMEALVADVDLLNVHLGPMWAPEVAAFVDSLEIPVAFTVHSPLRVPVTRRHIICVAPWIAELQRPSNPCHVIPNGVDLDVFYPPERRPKLAPTIVRTCRAERSAHYFWDSVTAVLARHPQARLRIAGVTGDSTAQVEFLGYRDDVPQILREATIFAHAPRPNDGAMDLSILEAMATGLAVVVTDVECVGGAIVNGRDGLLVPYGDVLAFERALERLVRDPALARKLGAAARERVERHYDIRVVVRQHELAYARIIGHRA